MDPTTLVQQPGAMNCPQTGGMEGMGGMMAGCPCMQMQHAMMSSPLGWTAAVVTLLLALAAIAALVALSVFLIRRSRPAVAR